METSDSLVKRLVSEIQQHSKFHQQNRSLDEAVRDLDIYDANITAPMKRSLITASRDSPSSHVHHLNPNSISNNNNHGESELSCYSSISSSVGGSALQANKQKLSQANGVAKNSEVRNNFYNHKQYNKMPSTIGQPSHVQLPQSSTPVLSSPNSHGNLNSKISPNFDLCPTCGQQKKSSGHCNSTPNSDQYRPNSNGFLKTIKHPSSPPPLPPAQDPARKLERLASFNKSDLVDDFRSTPNGLSRCISVPSLLCECAKPSYLDESKKRSTPKCSRCFPGARGRPCRYHKRDHHRPRDHHHRQQSSDLKSSYSPWIQSEFVDCEKCKKLESTVPNYNMDKHLSYYSGLPQFWDPEMWHKRRKKASMKSREKLLIVGMSLVSLIIFLTLTYYGVIAFQKLTEMPRVDKGGSD